MSTGKMKVASFTTLVLMLLSAVGAVTVVFYIGKLMYYILERIGL